jgi:hypothetical protein
LIEPLQAGGKREVFNLATDPNETTDLTGREPERDAHLHALLRERQRDEPNKSP